MIDLQLVRLQYEILNKTLKAIATEIQVPLASIVNEAEKNNWTQWWPGSITDLAPSSNTSNSSNSSSTTLTETKEDLLFDDDISPLEDGANTYVKEAKIRLQVYNLAKDLHLANKYAVLESALVDKANTVAENVENPADIRLLVQSLKDLPGKINAAALEIGKSDDGLPTLILKDLSGR